MEAADYKALLEQAEEELKAKTPGAYCSRKAAIRAMELLQAEGQVQFTQLEKGAEAMTKLIEAKAMDLKQAQATIERQAQAIKQLNEEKTRGTLNQRPAQIDRQEWYRMGKELDEREKNEQMQRMMMPRWEENKNGFAHYVGGIDPIGNAKPQIMRGNIDGYKSFTKAFNEILDKGSPWTEY